MEPVYPRVSMVVPVYRVQEPFLHRCVASILNQTYPNLEIVLVDDGSPDRCGLICDEYARADSRIRVIHQPNGGVTKARAEGVRAASGEWISFVDADDAFPHERVLSEMLGRALAEDLDIVLGASVDVLPDGRTSMNTNKIGSGIHTPERYVRALLAAQCIFGPACKVIKRRLFEEGTLDLPRYISQNEDMYMNIALALNARKIGIFNELQAYRYTVDSPTSVLKGGLMPEENWIELFVRIRELLLRKGMFGKVSREFSLYVNRTVLYKMHATHRQFARYDDLGIEAFSAFDRKVKRLNRSKLRCFLYMKKLKRRGR